MSRSPSISATLFTGLCLTLSCDKDPADTTNPSTATPPEAMAVDQDVDSHANASESEVTDETLVSDAATLDAIKTAIAADHRSPENKARDPHRHPLETLSFFGLQETMTVVELWPGGGGWYTEILAPVLRERGKLIVTNFDENGPPDAYFTNSAKKYQQKLASNPEVYDKVQVVTVRPPHEIKLGPPDSADLVLTFRNNHGWVGDGYQDKVYQAAFQVLKPGGVLGVVQHRAKPDADPQKSAPTGYLPEDYVIQTAEASGFKLVAKSEMNANSKDTKDHPNGVWNLPPGLRDKEKDKAKYLGIGESDRMTLKFVKPKT